MPTFNLATPKESHLRDYLGLEDKSTFSLGEIKSEILIIEIFSMYCPHCQKDAPAINKLYELTKNDEKLSKRLKLIGIGAGNSAYEVDIFKNKYKIPFPLFADDELIIHRKIGSVRTPYFIGICNQGKGKKRIFFSQLAGFSGAKKFLENIVGAVDCQ
ncbi:TlpA family protein disulfide reductase [bacterium]|nr:TlpA family protein disulfide reductase [bacterium]